MSGLLSGERRPTRFGATSCLRRRRCLPTRFNPRVGCDRLRCHHVAFRGGPPWTLTMGCWPPLGHHCLPSVAFRSTTRSRNWRDADWPTGHRSYWTGSRRSRSPSMPQRSPPKWFGKQTRNSDRASRRQRAGVPGLTMSITHGCPSGMGSTSSGYGIAKGRFSISTRPPRCPDPPGLPGRSCCPCSSCSTARRWFCCCTGTTRVDTTNPGTNSRRSKIAKVRAQQWRRQNTGPDVRHVRLSG